MKVKDDLSYVRVPFVAVTLHLYCLDVVLSKSAVSNFFE